MSVRLFSFFSRHVFSVSFIAALILANSVAYSLALQDKSWAALYMAIIVNPVMNGLFILAGCAFTFFRKRINPASSALPLVVVSITAPLVLSALLFVAILLLDIHGC